MPRTSGVECPGCPPLRALTTDSLGLIKVVEVHGNPGILKVVERWGQPDASSGVLAASYADDKIEPLLAVARKNGLVEILNSLNGESLCNTHIKQFGLSDTSGQDDHVVSLHLLKTKGIDLSSRVATLLCMENGSACLKSIPMSGVLHDSDIGSQMSFNVCSNGKILCSSLAKSENFALFGGKGVEVNTWDLGNCTRIWTAKSPRPNSLGLSPPPWFTAAAFLNEEDHRKIAAGTNNHQVRLYDTSAQRRPVMFVDYRETPIKAVCPDLHGYKVYVGNAYGDLGSFDIRTGKLLGGFTGKCSGSIRSIRKHPELSVIASCGLDCYLRVWDTNTRQLLSTVFLKQHLTNVIFDLHFSFEGVELAAKLFEYLKEWGIEKKVFSLTLDNASSNDNMQAHLKEQLSLHDSLLCDGEFFHVRCSAHILNLIVQEGLKVATISLNKIRESVKYVKGSETRMKKFGECVQEVGNIDTSIGLRLDVSTRWNSTYLMLDSAIKYKKAFASLQFNDKNYKYCPSSEEWKRGEKICEFLEPFYETTNLISGSSYPTSNLYFMQVWKIKVLLKENLLNEDEVISCMCKRMIEKFDKYWTQYSMVLAFGAILDPRIKLSMLEFFYSKVESDCVKCQKRIELVKTKLYKLFDQYSNTNKTSFSQSQSSSTTHTSSQSQSVGVKGKNKRIFDEMMAYESQTITSAGKFQLDLYLEEPKLEFAYYQDLDVLEHWKNQKHRYLILALMACDVLAIPITTVASESAFSIGARVLTKYRSCILHEKVQTLICTRN